MGWLASRTLDPRVVSLNPGLSVTCACVPGQHFTTNSVFHLGLFLRALRPARTDLRPARFTRALSELKKKKKLFKKKIIYKKKNLIYYKKKKIIFIFTKCICCFCVFRQPL